MGRDQMRKSVLPFALGALALALGATAASAHTPKPDVDYAPKAEAPYVRPDVQAYLKAFYAAPRPAFTRELLIQIHKMPPSVIAAMSSQDLPVGAMAVTRDVTMPGPGGPMALRLYDVRADRAPGPVVVFYHGGGYVLGSI